jgi:hypothetical protein
VDDPRPDRRQFLKTSALCGAALAGTGGLIRPAARSLLRSTDQKTQRVILVAFAGGVRTRETLGSPENVPNLVRMAREGVAYTRARTSNLGHFGAALSIFTGVAEARGIRENARGTLPTLFEYVRKDLALPASEVWISTSGGAQQANYAYSLHPDYGPSLGANTLDGDGIFNREFKGVLEAYGRPREMGAGEQALLERMRGAMRSRGDDESVNSRSSSAQIERYILDELTSGTTELRGVNAADAKALRVARNLLSFFQPKLLGIVLTQADVAHGSYNGYVEVVRRNDAMLGELWDSVKANPDLADSTAIFVLPEFGRDTDLNARRGLDHGDGSDDLNFVSIVAWGPDFRRNQEVQEEVRTIDVCPTVCGILGARARMARGERLPRLFG